MVLLNLFFAIAILLWATRMVRKGLSRFLGSRLQAMITSATKNRLRAIFTGFTIAGMLQSSSVTGVMASDFARKGLLSVPMGICILLGADIGSTIIVQFLSFDVSFFAPIAFLIGFIIFKRSANTHTAELGRAFMGIGLIILSLQMMSSSMMPLRNDNFFLSSLNIINEKVFFAIIVIAFFTWLMHSSIAMVLIIMGLMVGGTIDINSALIFVLGANIGAGFIPFILTIDSKTVARHIPLGSLIIRITVAVILIPFMPSITDYTIQYFGNTSFAVAMFHTLFNIVALILGLPFVNAIAKVCQKIMPAKKSNKITSVKSLKTSDIKNPSVALSAAEKEVINQADYIEKMLQGIFDVIASNDLKPVKKIKVMEENVDVLYEEIKIFTTKITIEKMTSSESQRATNTITYTTNLEHVGDIIERNLIDIANKKVQNNVSFTKEGWRDIEKIHNLVMRQLRLSITVFMNGGVEDARQLLLGKKSMQKMESESQDAHFSRLRAGIDDSIKSSALHLDIVRDLKRINTHLSSIAYPILEKHGELNSTIKK